MLIDQIPHRSRLSSFKVRLFVTTTKKECCYQRFKIKFTGRDSAESWYLPMSYLFTSID